MKKIIIFLMLGLCVTCGSKKEDDNGLLLGLAYLATANNASTGLATTPEANAANDNSARGIYKGVIVGSSGNFKINYDNANTGSNVPVFEYSYTATGSATTSGSINGTASVSGNSHTLTFTQSPFSLTIVLSNVGVISSVTLQISGTTVAVSLYKETSTSLVRMFEGTFTGNVIVGNTDAYTGVWNFTTNGESSFSAATKTLKIANNNCTENCDNKYENFALDSTSKKVVDATGVSFSCYQGLCNCRTTASSNEGITLSTNDVTGTWITKIVTTCNAASLGLGTLTAGTNVVSGTWKGSRTK
ncbi:hypothetical protein [Leptospira sp. GIMC2001]|uniref:hypothetical protein n=1 Tax=Leptospira sp. GIMC2001 TaxID=1513297 RepID=UPI00234BD0CA|nr:hypothetical protein [Leptospira sp. GIMC2001]WCL49986.1 hypothetical protein O4O04_03980 [Leptospira sp. GIMC2001]